ncbi:MAG: endonuclease/exonuclease/phosphatase family protein [Rubricella sp.]
MAHRPRAGGLIAALVALVAATGALSETIRVATFNTSLSRPGIGLLLDTLQRGGDPQTEAIAAILQHVRPDIVLLSEVDHDPEGRTLAALIDYLAVSRRGQDGIVYPHGFAIGGNAGIPTGADLDGNGRTTDAEDAQGWGRFPGERGLAVLSRFPLVATDAVDLSARLWSDMPGARPPAGFPGYRPELQRLSSRAHVALPVEAPGGRIVLMISNPTAPVFDGPEDFNGRRNADEIALWARYLDGELPDAPPPVDPVILLGDLALDPEDGDGRHEAIRALLDHPRLQDVAPASRGAALAGAAEARLSRHAGPDALDTTDRAPAPGPGNLRLDYVLPDVALAVAASGVFWPAPDEAAHDLLRAADSQASDHRLVWIDIALP